MKPTTSASSRSSRRKRVSNWVANRAIEDQLERNQLFYVFEQFFAHAKENPEPLNKAQEAIVDYFKDTENTFFFDKNKIQ